MQFRALDRDACAPEALGGGLTLLGHAAPPWGGALGTPRAANHVQRLALATLVIVLLAQIMRLKGQPLHVIGGSWRAQVAAQRWDRMPEEDKAAHMALMRAGIPVERTELHIQHLSAANRAAWRAKLIGTERKCRTCGTGFVLDNLLRWYCTK